MPEIEFVEVDPPRLPPGGERRVLPDRQALLGLIPAVLALAAAALAAWSPFLWLYNITSPSEDGIDFISTDPADNKKPAYNHLHMDAWGRFFLGHASTGGSQGSRLGIVLLVGAGVLVLAALALGWASLAPRSRAAGLTLHSGRALLVAGASVCGAMSAACYVEYIPVRDRYQGNRSLDPSLVATQIHVTVGTAWLVAAIAGILALTGLAVNVALGRFAAVSRNRDGVSGNVSQAAQI